MSSITHKKQGFWFQIGMIYYINLWYLTAAYVLYIVKYSIQEISVYFPLMNTVKLRKYLPREVWFSMVDEIVFYKKFWHKNSEHQSLTRNCIMERKKTHVNISGRIRKCDEVCFIKYLHVCIRKIKTSQGIPNPPETSAPLYRSQPIFSDLGPRNSSSSSHYRFFFLSVHSIFPSWMRT